MEETKGNIVMFPFMAQGHIIPFLALALELEKRDYIITFVSTPLNINKLQPLIPPRSAICLREIPFNSSDHGLPPDCETTESLPLPLMVHLITASPALQPAFRDLVADLVCSHGRRPICIISDMFFGWSAKIAHEFGSCHAIFNAGGGYGMAVFHSLWLNLPHTKANSDEFPIPGFPEGHRIHTNQLPDHLKAATTADPWYHFSRDMFRDWLESDAILFNTIEEIDHVGLEYFRKQIGCKVCPIGPIHSSLGSKARAGKESKPTLKLCMKFLDSKPENSVLYVAFGTQSAPSMSQTMELAMALEASGKNFIWVVRTPSDHNGSEQWFLAGFEEWIRDRGLLLVERWAPQSEILSHKSIGAFLSHCGWNSVLEALGNGVPILSWPMGAEQHFNAKMLEEEMGVCVGVTIGSDEVKCGDIVKKIEVVMGGGSDWEVMKIKSMEVRDKLRKAKEEEDDGEEGIKGASRKNMDGFLRALL